ncbi:MAG: site-specific integrase [Candidatus Methanomethylicaceae archaeon]
MKIKGARDTPRLRDERVPTQEELKKIFMAWDRRARVACALIAHSGLRLEVLGNYKGKDGLRVGDIPDLVLGSSVDFRRVPAMVVVRRELSKAGHQYFTFIGKEGCAYLKDYLEGRMRSGERLTPASPVVRSKGTRKSFIRTTNISDIIRAAMRKAGFPWRPYVLRSYFDTQLMLAESKGLIIRDYRQFFMGHKGDIENRYTTNKCRLPPDVVEDMRPSYARCLDYLETDRPRTDQDELIIIPLGVLRYSFMSVFIPLLMGKLLMCFLLAYFGNIFGTILLSMFGEENFWLGALFTTVLLILTFIVLLKVDWEKIFENYMAKKVTVASLVLWMELS